VSSVKKNMDRESTSISREVGVGGLMATSRNTLNSPVRESEIQREMQRLGLSIDSLLTAVTDLATTLSPIMDQSEREDESRKEVSGTPPLSSEFAQSISQKSESVNHIKRLVAELQSRIQL